MPGRSRQRWSLRAAAFSVKPTISVKRTVARTRSTATGALDQVGNSSIASEISSALLPT
jgi:hypothetical protein